jgi:hypothetical protein
LLRGHGGITPGGFEKIVRTLVGDRGFPTVLSMVRSHDEAQSFYTCVYVTSIKNFRAREFTFLRDLTRLGAFTQG